MAIRTAYLGMVIATGNLGEIMSAARTNDNHASRDVVLAMIADDDNAERLARHATVNQYGKPLSRRQARRYNFR